MTRLLSGDEEAELTRRGSGTVDAGTLLVDIGGGSTELVLDDFQTSLPMGSVRFTERHGEDVAALEAAARALLAGAGARADGGRRRRRRSRRSRRSTSASRSTTAKRVDGHLLTRDGARAQLERLAALPLEERRQRAGARAGARAGDRRRRRDPRRDPRRLRLDAITVSERGLLHGAALAAAELPEPDEGAAPPGAYTCC